MKLVLTYYWGDEPCSGTSHLPFEYENKDKFLFDMFEKYPKKHWQTNEYPYAKIFDCYLDKYAFDNLEYNVSTLEDWFEKNKQ